MSEIKPANERLSDYLKTLSPRLNQFAIAHIAETVLPQFQIEEAIELRAAYEALKEKLERLNGLYHAEVSKHQLDYNALKAENERLRQESANYENASKITNNWNLEIANANGNLRQKNEALQAKIDSLMLEYCPDEMTPEQIENYAAHQVKVVICNP